MVVEYLEQTKKQFVDKRESLLDEISSLEIKSKENIRMIQMLEDTNDDNFESFSPREVSSYTKSKMVELSEEQKQIQQLLQDYRSEVLELNLKIDEVTSVIKVAQNENEICNEEISKSKKSNLNVLESVEKERQRIARDLHDSTVQNLTSLVHKSELCMKLIDLDPIRCKLELSSMGKILREVIEDMRKMFYDLRPMSFDDIGFGVTIERALDKCKAAYNIRYSFKIEGEEYQLPNMVSISLLRIIQESCSNAINHGNAKMIDIKLIYHEDSIELMVENDGDGFDVSTIDDLSRDDNSGFGLSMMKERIYLLSGDLSIQSKAGEKGCLLTVNLPIEREDM